MANTPRLDTVSPKRQRIAELARHAPEMVFTSLAHHIDRDVLHAAYVATRKDGAVGLDGQTAADYAVNLEANLQSLLDRFKSGQDVAPYLHHVLDVWFTAEVQPRLRGRSVLVRYADDVVIVVEQESDAHRVLAVLPKRLGRFGLTMHPDKSRLVRFRRPRLGWRPGPDGDRFPPPGTFDFLGFTHYWGLARNGSWGLKRKTAKDRLRRSLTSVNRWCGAHRHASVAEQHRMLVRKLRGHCAYFGIRGNASSLTTFGFHVVHIWHTWLNRRSQQRSMPWKRFLRLLARYPLPRMTAVHVATRV